MAQHKVFGKPHSRKTYTVGFGRQRDKEGRPVPEWTCGHEHVKQIEALQCKMEREHLRGYYGTADSPYYIIRNLTGHILRHGRKRL